jgi:hypothetical protein
MSVLDHPDVADQAEHVLHVLHSQAAEHGVDMSPFAADALANLVVSPLYEPARSVDDMARSERGDDVFSYCSDRLPEIVRDIVEVYEVSQRTDLRGIITGADVYHWLADRSGEVLPDMWCPYDKD